MNNGFRNEYVLTDLYVPLLGLGVLMMPIALSSAFSEMLSGNIMAIDLYVYVFFGEIIIGILLALLYPGGTSPFSLRKKSHVRLFTAFINLLSLLVSLAMGYFASSTILKSVGRVNIFLELLLTFFILGVAEKFYYLFFVAPGEENYENLDEPSRSSKILLNRIIYVSILSIFSTGLVFIL